MTQFYLIFKSGSRGDTKAYRPIALLNQAYKIFTTIINNRLKKLVEEVGIFDDSQNGFRSGRSVHDNILTLLAAIERAGLEGRANGEHLHILFF